MPLFMLHIHTFNCAQERQSQSQVTQRVPQAVASPQSHSLFLGTPKGRIHSAVSRRRCSLDLAAYYVPMEEDVCSGKGRKPPIPFKGHPKEEKKVHSPDLDIFMSVYSSICILPFSKTGRLESLPSFSNGVIPREKSRESPLLQVFPFMAQGSCWLPGSRAFQASAGSCKAIPGWLPG